MRRRVRPSALRTRTPQELLNDLVTLDGFESCQYELEFSDGGERRRLDDAETARHGVTERPGSTCTWKQPFEKRRNRRLSAQISTPRSARAVISTLSSDGTPGARPARATLYCPFLNDPTRVLIRPLFLQLT